MVTYDFGGQMAETSEIENYMGYRFVTGLDLTDKFKEQVQQFDIPIAWGQKVTAVRRGDGRFTVETDQGGAFQARTLILATGKRYRLLGVPGEKELAGHGVAYCPTCDAPFFKNKVVFIAGGGNSAFTAALDLVKVARDVTMLNFAADWQADPILQQAVERFGDRVKRLNRGDGLLAEIEEEPLKVVPGLGEAFPRPGLRCLVGIERLGRAEGAYRGGGGRLRHAHQCARGVRRGRPDDRALQADRHLDRRRRQGRAGGV